VRGVRINLDEDRPVPTLIAAVPAVMPSTRQQPVSVAVKAPGNEKAAVIPTPVSGTVSGDDRLNLLPEIVELSAPSVPVLSPNSHAPKMVGKLPGVKPVRLTTVPVPPPIVTPDLSHTPTRLASPPADDPVTPEQRRLWQVSRELPKTLDAAIDSFARYNADLRGSHLQVLQSNGSWFRRAMTQLRNVLPTWYDGRISRYGAASQQAYAQLEARRRAMHAEASKAIIGILAGNLATATVAYHGEGRGITTKKAIAMQLDVMEIAEQRTHFYQDRTQNGRTRSGDRYSTNLDLMGDWLTKHWTQSGWRGRAFRIVAPALPALATGAALGLIASGIGIPVVALAGGAFSGLTGRWMGHRLAQTVNHRSDFAGSRPDAYRARREEAFNRVATAYRAYQGQIEADLGKKVLSFDTALGPMEGTRIKAAENAHYYELAGAVGALACGFGFGFGEIAGSAAGLGHHLTSAPRPNGHHLPNGNHQPTASPTKTTPSTPQPTNQGGGGIDVKPHNTVAPTVPGVNPNQATWSVAHLLHPGHEQAFMQHIMSLYNHQFGSHLHFVKQPNGFEWIMNQTNHGNVAFNRATQLQFNQFMLANAKAA